MSSSVLGPLSLLKGLLVSLGLFFHFLKIQAKWYQLRYEEDLNQGSQL